MPIVTARAQYIFDIRLMLKLAYFCDGESVKLDAKQNFVLAAFLLDATGSVWIRATRPTDF